MDVVVWLVGRLTACSADHDQHPTQITLAHGRVVTFEGTVDDLANAAFAAGLADGRPRGWVRALLPERWAMVRVCGCVWMWMRVRVVELSIRRIGWLPTTRPHLSVNQ